MELVEVVMRWALVLLGLEVVRGVLEGAVRGRTSLSIGDITYDSF